MTHTNLTPGKKARGGKSYAVSAYLMPEHQALFERMRRDMSGPALSKLLGGALLGIMHDQGYYHVACPKCGAVALERDVQAGLDDEWLCGACRHLSPFGDWKEVTP